jgi:hypothetical protein
MAHEDARIQRLTDAAVAEEVAAGRFPTGDAAKDIRLHVEAAVHLANLAENDPETVYVVGCSREILLEEEGPGGYLVIGRVARTISCPDQRVSLIVATGVAREEVLVRLAHIQAHVEALPVGTFLAPGRDEHTLESDCAARLEAARRVALDQAGESEGG